MIYMDNAATTMHKPQEVIDAVVSAMSSMGNAGRGASEAALSASRIIYDTREGLAKLFGAENARQIAFTSNSTESLNIAIKGILDPGDHVITTVLEHNSVLRPLYEMEKKGTELSVIGCNEKGMPDIAAMEAAIKENTKMIICTNGSNLTGNYVDVAVIGKMDIDILCFTGHKGLLGPQGTGGIYVKEGIQIRPLKTGGSGIQTYNKEHPVQMPTALEAGTLNGHGIAGLHAALGYLEKTGIDNIRKKEENLMWRFYNGVKDVPGVKIYGDYSQKERCAIVTLNIGDYDSSEVSDELLMEYDISTRSGGHCAPLMHEALGTVEQGAVRFSFSHYNTEEEVDTAIRAIRELAEEP